MDLEPWIPVIAPVATVLAAFIAAIPVFRQAQTRREEEARATLVSQAETEAQMLQTFVALMSKAHARGESVVAEAFLQSLVESGSDVAPTTLQDLRDILSAATVTYPVGAAEQEAAIAAIGELGSRYDFLRDPARAGLQNISSWNDPPQAVAAALGKLGPQDR